MKRLLLLALVAVPLFATTVSFIYSDYGYYENDYWYDEYWEDNYCYDGYWVYYPHGYYCVHYVWWYPWWWDWYWYRCHWHHHFHWDFFYSGFYVVWYDGGHWWFRPRYGRWVRYKVPYSYYELRYRAGQHGINLPPKPPRELNIPYKEGAVRELIKQNDPEGFKRIEKEHQSGNLEKMKKQYIKETEKKIAVKNQEYKKYDQEKNTQVKSDPYKKTQVQSNEAKKANYYPTDKRVERDPVKTSNTKNSDDRYYNEQKSEPNIKTREKSEVKTTKKTPPSNNYNEEKKTVKKQTSSNAERKNPNYYEKKETSPQKNNSKVTAPVEKKSPSNMNKGKDNYESGAVKKKR